MTLLLVLPAIVLLVTATLLAIAWFRQSDETYGEAIAIGGVVCAAVGIYLLVAAFGPMGWTPLATAVAYVAAGYLVAIITGVIVGRRRCPVCKVAAPRANRTDARRRHHPVG